MAKIFSWALKNSLGETKGYAYLAGLKEGYCIDNKIEDAGKLKEIANTVSQYSQKEYTERFGDMVKEAEENYGVPSSAFKDASFYYNVGGNILMLSGADGVSNNAGLTCAIFRNEDKGKILTEEDTPTFGATYYNKSSKKLKPDVLEKHWTDNVETRLPGQVTWMCSAYFRDADNGEQITSWCAPILITGEDGRDGSDGKSSEFIYALTENENQPPKYPTTEEEIELLFNTLAESSEPYPVTVSGLTTNWYDRAQAIDSEKNLAEWVWNRFKKAGSDKWVYTQKPVLWALWGSDGTDGDGVEYIFIRSVSAETDSYGNYVYPTELAIEWPLWGPEDFNSKEWSEVYNKDKYVPGPVKTQSGGGMWTDNPKGVGPAFPFEWVSVRKYNKQDESYPHYDDIDKKDKTAWGAFSEPKLWANHSKKGVSTYTAFIFTRTNDTNVTNYWVDGGDYYNPLKDIRTYADYEKTIPVTGITWSDTVPSGSTLLYMCRQVFGDEDTGEENDGWSQPVLMVDNPDFQVEYSVDYNPEKAPVLNFLPSLNGFIDDSDEGVDEGAWRAHCLEKGYGWWGDDSDEKIKNPIYMATCRRASGTWTDWVISKIKGEAGVNVDFTNDKVLIGTDKDTILDKETIAETDVFMNNGLESCTDLSIVKLTYNSINITIPTIGDKNYTQIGPTGKVQLKLSKKIDDGVERIHFDFLLGAKLDLTDPIYIGINLSGKNEQGLTVTGVNTFVIAGLKGGEEAVQYNIIVNPHGASVNSAGIFNVNELTITINKTEGKNTRVLTGLTTTQKLYYSLGNSTDEKLLTYDTTGAKLNISTIEEGTINFKFWVNGVLVDEEGVHIVRDGQGSLTADLDNENILIGIGSDTKLDKDSFNHKSILTFRDGTNYCTDLELVTTHVTNGETTFDISIGTSMSPIKPDSLVSMKRSNSSTAITFTMNLYSGLELLNPYAFTFVITGNTKSGKKVQASTTLTLAGLKGGAEALYYHLTTIPTGINVSENGTWSSENIKINVQEIVGNETIDVTAGTVNWGVNDGELSQTLSLSDTGATLTKSEITGITLSPQTVTFKFTKNNFIETETLYIVTDGKNGKDGKDGVSAYRLDINNQAATINCDSNGNILSGAIRPHCTATLYLGSEKVTGVTYSISSTSTPTTGLTIDSSTGVLTFNDGSASQPFNFGENTLEITIQAKINNVLYGEVIMTVSKALAGTNGSNGNTPYVGSNGNWWIAGQDTGIKAEGKDGEDGTDGATPYINNGYWYINGQSTGVKAEGIDGNDAVSYWLNLTADAIQVTTGGTANPSTISVTGYKQVGENSPSTASDCVIKWGYNTVTPSSGNTSAVTITNIDTSKNYITFQMLHNNVQVDLETVPILHDGRNGQQGRQGAALRGPVKWDDQTTTRRFCNGQLTDASYPEDALWIDIIIRVENNIQKYYYCNTSYNGSCYDAWSTVSSNWTLADKQFDFIATNLLLAQNAAINFLTGNEIYLRDNEGKITAGAAGGSNVNFWAGDTNDGRFLEQAPFRVYNNGKVYASNAEIQGSLECVKTTDVYTKTSQMNADTFKILNTPVGGDISSISIEILDEYVHPIDGKMYNVPVLCMVYGDKKYFLTPGSWEKWGGTGGSFGSCELVIPGSALITGSSENINQIYEEMKKYQTESSFGTAATFEENFQEFSNILNKWQLRGDSAQNDSIYETRTIPGSTVPSSFVSYMGKHYLNAEAIDYMLPNKIDEYIQKLQGKELPAGVYYKLIEKINGQWREDVVHEFREKGGNAYTFNVSGSSVSYKFQLLESSGNGHVTQRGYIYIEYFTYYSGYRGMDVTAMGTWCDDSPNIELFSDAH